MSTESTPNTIKSVRSIRSLGVFGGAAITISIGVGLGVYDLLGLFVTEFGRSSAAPPYLLMILVALPIILTYAERAAIFPGENGAYALARSGRWLSITYFSGWLLMGGYATLIALLAWGAGFHLKLGLELFDIDAPARVLAPVIIALLAAGNALGFTRSWSHRARMVTIAVVLILILSVRGMFAEVTIPGTVTLFASDAPVLRMTLFVSSALWGIILLLGMRNEITGRAQSMQMSMLTGVIVSGLLGAFAALALGRYGGSLSPLYAPLLTFTSVEGFFPSSLLKTLYIIFGFAINFFAIDRVLIDSLHLFEGMTGDGFLPAHVQRFQSKDGALGWPLLFVTLLAGLLVILEKPMMLAGLAAVTFFWSTALIHLPDLFAAKNSSLARRTKLPFHPLFPALTIAISALLPFNLPWRQFWPMLVWIAGGLLLYLLYAHAHGLEIRKNDVVSEEDPFDSYLDEARNTVLVAITDTGSAPNLIQAGLQIARGRGSTLLVLRVLQVPEQTAEDWRRQLAQHSLASLEALITEAESGTGSDRESGRATDAGPPVDSGISANPDISANEVPVRALVRIGLDPTQGILEAVSAQSVDLLLVNWSGKLDPNEPIADARINRLMRDAQCDIAVLHGKMPAKLSNVVVSIAGGPHARYAVELADSLIETETDADLRVVHILMPESDQDDRKAAMQMIEEAINGLDSAEQVEYAQVSAPGVKEGLLGEAAGADLLLVGAYRDSFFQRSQFRGIATSVAAESSTPTLIVRAQEEMRYLFLARIWEFISDPLPALKPEQRAIVNKMMVAAAKPSIDFYVLIILSAVIATLGLLQNSTAVIIGAMLVAPLMSPILAMAMGMANGDPKTIAGGAEVTAKGVAMAIFVGAIVAMFSPLQEPTNEILVRTAPNLLDLMVALASGAAAGYAISRSEVAAALPGVAIAAALVPPLCVVGYGLGTSQLTYATGAMLLFTTNLVAIVLSASLTFVALGFHASKTDKTKIMHGVRLTIVSLLAITAILVATTVFTVGKLNRKVAVEEVFQQPALSNRLTVENIEVDRKAGVYYIEATIITLSDSGLSSNELAKLEELLTEAVGGPAQLNATVLSGARFSSSGYGNRRQAEILFVESVEDKGGSVLEQSSSGGQYSVIIEATIVEEEPGSLDDKTLAVIQQQVADEIGMPVTLRVTVLSGQHVELSPTLTVTPIKN